MMDAIPTSFLEGMQDTRQWSLAVAERLGLRPPLSPPHQLHRPNGLWGIEWQQRCGREMIFVGLTPYPDRVKVDVWSALWDYPGGVSYEAYCALVTWVGWTMIHGDPEAAQLRLVVQSYADAKAAQEQEQS